MFSCFHSFTTAVTRPEKTDGAKAAVHAEVMLGHGAVTVSRLSTREPWPRVVAVGNQRISRRCRRLFAAGEELQESKAFATGALLRPGLVFTQFPRFCLTSLNSFIF